MIIKLDHANLSSSDIDRSIAFYRDVLGMKLGFQAEPCGEEFEKLFNAPAGFRSRVAQFEEGLEISQFIAPPGRNLNLKPWDIGVVFLIFRVTDLDSMYSTLVEKGVEFINPPVTQKSPLSSGGSLKVAHLYGPDGERISLMEFIND